MGIVRNFSLVSVLLASTSLVDGVHADDDLGIADVEDIVIR